MVQEVTGQPQIRQSYVTFLIEKNVGWLPEKESHTNLIHSFHDEGIPIVYKNDLLSSLYKQCFVHECVPKPG